MLQKLISRKFRETMNQYTHSILEETDVQKVPFLTLLEALDINFV